MDTETPGTDEVLKKPPALVTFPEMEQAHSPISVTEEDIVELWRTVGASKSLTTDADIARFLLSV